MTFSKLMLRVNQKFIMFPKQIPNTKCVERWLMCLNLEDNWGNRYVLDKVNSIDKSNGLVLRYYYQKTEINQ